jgi:hypothetical protein
MRERVLMRPAEVTMVSMRSAKGLRKAHIEGVDGSFGSVSDLYFDSHSWDVRYIVVDTGKWLPGRRVLISPEAVVPGESTADVLRLKLTKEQIEKSPDVAIDQPISRQIEAMLYTYYGWPAYWSAGPSAGGMMPPIPAPPPPLPETGPNPFLRSTEEVHGYHVQAVDGDIGHLEDFLTDDDMREIRATVVDTRNWLPGKKVLVPLPWVDEIDWEQQRVKLHVSRQDVKDSPEYNPSET